MKTLLPVVASLALALPVAAAGGAGEGVAPDAPAADAPAADAPAAVDPAAVAPATDARRIGRKALAAAREGRPADAAALFAEALVAPGAGDDHALRDALLRDRALAALQSGDAASAANLFATLPGPDAATGLGLAKMREAEAAAADIAAATNAAMRAAATKRRLEAAQAAADAFGVAARASSADSAALTNLATVLSLLPDWRNEAADAAREAKYGDKTAEELFDTVVSASRSIYAEAAKASALDGPQRIAALEALAARQSDLADAWVPLADKVDSGIRSATTNEETRSAAAAMLGDAAEKSATAVDAFEAADADAAQDALRAGESAAIRLRAAFADPIPLLRQALDAQSNALARAVSPERVRNPVEEQAVAISFFDIFSQKVEPWLDSLEGASADGDPQSATGPAQASPAAIGGAEIPLSEEDRKLVLKLCEETAGTHSLLSMGISPVALVLPQEQLPNATQSAENMAKLLEILTKTQPPQQQQQQQQNQQQQNQSQQQQRQSGESGDDNRNQQSSPQDSGQDGNQNRQEQNPATPEESGTGEPDEAEDADEPDAQDDETGESATEAQSAEKGDDADEDEAARLMRKVLDLEKRYEEEKRRRRGRLPPRVGERDW